MINNYHPDYNLNNWAKWRLTYKSGQDFINNYLFKFSRREDDHAFNGRKRITYVPAFAKSAVNDIKNAIYQRTVDIIRDGGPLSYQRAITGADSGVDLFGSTMSYFIGQKVLPELLPMGKVGVYVDMPILPGPTKLDKGNRHPYFYIYPVEDIINWVYTDNELTAVLLREHAFKYSDEGLPIDKVINYRYLSLINDQVNVAFYDDSNNIINQEILSINKIPFEICDLGDSIIADVCDYQIALMNMESSDLAYILLSNYPFYVEQFDPRQDALFNKGNNEDIETGISQGRRYSLGMNEPSFINPSSEPLKISIEKQNELKSDIKALVNIAVSNLGPKMASAESKAIDMVGLEAGLSYIGLVLQNLENRLSEYWSLYEESDPATIIYPTEYSLPDQATIDSKITKMFEVMDKINSITLRKTLAKRIARLMIGNRLPATTLFDIDKEIDNAEIINTDPKAMLQDVINGILDPESAAKARGYPDNTVQKAQDYQAKRVAIIQASQSPADKGIKDLSPTNKTSPAEKINPDGTPKPTK